MKALLIPAGICLTVLCWGMYGPVLHHGQNNLGGNRLKPLICVGAAYFIVALLLPIGVLIWQGKLGGEWTPSGIQWSMMAGAAGAFGAMGIILALTSGGRPVYVMPLVFGGAPVVNVALSMYWSKAWKQGLSPLFLVGLACVIAGAALVLIYAPKPKRAPTHATAPEAGVLGATSDSSPSAPGE